MGERTGAQGQPDCLKLEEIAIVNCRAAHGRSLSAVHVWWHATCCRDRHDEIRAMDKAVRSADGDAPRFCAGVGVTPKESSDLSRQSSEQEREQRERGERSVASNFWTPLSFFAASSYWR